MDKPAVDFAHIVTHGDAGIEDLSDIAAPLHLTSTFRAASAAAFAEMATESHHPRYYTRYGNPTTARAESVVAQLEGAEAALLSSTGMGAMSTAILTLVNQGDQIVAQRNHYMGTSKLLAETLPRFGVDVAFVDQTDVNSFAAAISERTRLVIVESPANPTMQLTDLTAVAAIAREAGALTIADNTFASPLNQRPAEHGIDLVMHSGTKYLGGHHDLLAGVIAGSRQLIEKIWETSILTGATASPFDAWLLLRGMRTLPIRIARQNATAQCVAEFLQRHGVIEVVHYPGLPSHPQYELAKRQMRGFGGVMSFEVAGGYETTRDFVSALNVVEQAVSLGGYESLAVHAAAMWEGTLGAEGALAAGVRPNLVRLAVGLENAAELIADLDAALHSATGQKEIRIGS